MRGAIATERPAHLARLACSGSRHGGPGGCLAGAAEGGVGGGPLGDRHCCLARPPGRGHICGVVPVGESAGDADHHGPGAAIRAQPIGVVACRRRQSAGQQVGGPSKGRSDAQRWTGAARTLGAAWRWWVAEIAAWTAWRCLEVAGGRGRQRAAAPCQPACTCLRVRGSRRCWWGWRCHRAASSPGGRPRRRCGQCGPQSQGSTM